MPALERKADGPCEAEQLMLSSYDRFLETLNNRPRAALALAQQTAQLWGVTADVSGATIECVAHRHEAQ